MIVKDKDSVPNSGLRAEAGDRQEADVAFYLRREFANNPKVMVLNDLRLVWNGETAQIDHLLIHPLGFVLVESKSIYGEVRVNEREEWSRSYKGSWSGMPSPIQQLNLQQRLLKVLLENHNHQLLGKVLGIQAGVGGREWQNVCAVSSSAILHREGMPAKISDCVVKSEFIGEHLTKIMDLGKGAARKLLNGRPLFFEGEIERISQFLLSKHQPRAGSYAAVAAAAKKPRKVAKQSVVAEKPAVAEPKFTEPQSEAVSGMACKHCDEKINLSGASGRWGYFVRCGVCEKNTGMRSTCEQCDSTNGKVRKSGNTYSFHCGECSHIGVVFEQP